MVTRKFNGQEFKSFAKTRKKSNAKESAERLRSGGDKVRVVKSGSGFEIFTKKGRKRRSK